MNIKLDKKDYLRSLLTDTSPGDVPIIFSNEGFYINAKIYMENKADLECYLYIREIFECYLVGDKTLNLATVPFKYRIYKDGKSLRVLSLLHPASQLQISNLYKESAPLINSLCSKSKFSIRAPVKVANSFYSNSNERIMNGSYKKFDIDTIESELYKRRASSYFSYKGVNRLYKFYNSNHYIEMEKKYSNMWMLDISNCFNSIYTHSIGWAINTKDYSKLYASRKLTHIADKIDSMIRRSNYNETNGIPIGNEFSRVVAEIIFQEIDLRVESFLEEKFNLNYGQEYEIIRYVDDYILYADSTETLDCIVKSIGDQISKFNFFLNESKFEKFKRPILTGNSSLIISLKSLILDLDKIVFFGCDAAADHKVVNEIRRVQAVKISFIDKVKRACLLSNNGYGVASSFLIAVFGKRIDKIIQSAKYKISKGLKFSEIEYSDEALAIRSCLQLYMELIFYFYSVSPTLNSSTNLSQSMIALDRFMEKYIPKHNDFLRTLFIFDIEKVLKSEDVDGYRDNYISLEKMNILLSISEFDNEKYSIDLKVIELIVETNIECLSYFEIISILFYIKNNPKYHSIKKTIESKCKGYMNHYKKNNSLKDLSDGLHLTLDLVCCPYVDISVRRQAIRTLLNSICKNERNTVVDKILDILKDRYWFVNWSGGDVYNLLVRKSLKSTY